VDNELVDFVYEFAKGLKKILDTIEYNSNYSVYQKNEILLDKTLRNSAPIIEDLFTKYRPLINLQLHRESHKLNFEF